MIRGLLHTRLFSAQCFVTNCNHKVIYVNYTQLEQKTINQLFYWMKDRKVSILLIIEPGFPNEGMLC